MKRFMLLIISIFLLCGFSSLLATTGDPVVIETISGDLLIGVEGDSSNMVLLMSPGISYCVSSHKMGMGMGKQDMQTKGCPKDSLVIANKYIIHRTIEGKVK